MKILHAFNYHRGAVRPDTTIKLAADSGMDIAYFRATAKRSHRRLEERFTRPSAGSIPQRRR